MLDEAGSGDLESADAVMAAWAFETATAHAQRRLYGLPIGVSRFDTSATMEIH